MKTTLLKSEDYARSPWKNGGGIFTDIADAHRAESNVKDWDSLLWRFASTPIVAPGPFSHMPGIDRLQMVIGGRGLVLKAPGQEFDEREPFTTVRFTGEMEIVIGGKQPGQKGEADARSTSVVSRTLQLGGAEVTLEP